MDTPESESKFVVCRCQHCEGGIQFDASGFVKGETRTVECPHCKLETIIFVPPIVLSIGKIRITADRVMTPCGSAALAGSQWAFSEFSRIEEIGNSSALKPSHVRAMPFPLLLLFSIQSMFERKTKIFGFVEISVQSGIFYYKDSIPIESRAGIDRIRELVNKAQVLANKH